MPATRSGRLPRGVDRGGRGRAELADAGALVEAATVRDRGRRRGPSGGPAPIRRPRAELARRLSRLVGSAVRSARSPRRPAATGIRARARSLPRLAARPRSIVTAAPAAAVSGVALAGPEPRRPWHRRPRDPAPRSASGSSGPVPDRGASRPPTASSARRRRRGPKAFQAGHGLAADRDRRRRDLGGLIVGARARRRPARRSSPSRSSSSRSAVRRSPSMATFGATPRRPRSSPSRADGPAQTGVVEHRDVAGARLALRAAAFQRRRACATTRSATVRRTGAPPRRSRPRGGRPARLAPATGGSPSATSRSSTAGNIPGHETPRARPRCRRPAAPQGERPVHGRGHALDARPPTTGRRRGR